MIDILQIPLIYTSRNLHIVYNTVSTEVEISLNL